jgi:stage II sporulation protein D
MIRNILKKAALFLSAAMTITTIFSVNSDAGNNGTDANTYTVRVGLFYKGSSVNTAQSIIDVSAKAGVRIGFASNDSFTEISTVAGSLPLYIHKDSYYYNTGSGLKEFDPSNSKISGAKYGPYHIRIGTDYPDAASASGQASIYKQAGVDAFIAYNDAWQVWTGLYVDEATANEAIAGIKAILGEAGYEIIRPSDNRITVTDTMFKTVCIFRSSTAYFQVRPTPENDPPVINVKGTPYRGAIEVRRLAGSDMTVINVVSMREYLYGNVPPEIGGRSPAEALKAQAVVSKMYAINNKGKHGSTGFDICATTHCQVYKGYNVETADCNKFIDEVADKVITYEGKPVEHVYYFASGGGSTEDVHNVWGSSYPYLVSVEDKYEKIYTWTKTLRAADVKAKLPGLGSILGITITRTAPTGRVTQLAVTGTSRGEPEYYSNEKCRTLFGLDSQLYTITTDADVYTAGLSDKQEPADAAVAEDSIDGQDQNEGNVVGTPVQNSEDGTAANDNEDGTEVASDNGSEQKAENVGEEPDADQKEEPSKDKPKKFNIVLPYASDPGVTQLGGKKVITASGIDKITGVSNKVAIIGADGIVSHAAVVPETYTFTGKGWGHAVGMSQEGAIGMAKAGITYDDIIRHYFKGTDVQ